MEHLADEFIQRRRTVVVGRGKRYPEPLRQLAVVFATEAEAAGWSANRISKRLGIAGATLERWWAEAEPQGRMREVVVRDAVASERLAVLVTPEGYRVENLRQTELIEILRALRQ